MRLLRVGLITAFTVGTACASVPASAPGPAGGMPANTVRLSTVMQQLSARPGFTEAFLKQVEGGTKKAGAALLTPALVDHLRKLILGKDWETLDRFPGWTMREINPTVRVIAHVAGKDQKVEGMATAGGAPSGAPNTTTHDAIASYLDVGPYSLLNAGRIDLTKPSALPGFDERELVSNIGDEVTRGDGPSMLAATHAASQRLAFTLNRLAANSLDDVPSVGVDSLYFHMVTHGEIRPAPPLGPSVVYKPIMVHFTPDDLIADLQRTGHTVTVTDSRYFANFGHLHYEGRDVMMPFWVNSQILIPGTKNPLLVPVSHAEYEWQIRGPHVNADVSFYFGIDGHAQWRTMDQLDQAWVMKRDAHTYIGPDAVEVTRLNAEILRAYARLHQAHPAIPFGGYYGFGVCQDVVAAIELKMTGKATLFPNTADERFFSDPRDAEINSLIKRLPKDRIGQLPDVERIFGSLPVGTSEAELASISIPGLGEQMIAVHRAWSDGTLKRTRTGLRLRLRLAFAAIGLTLACGIVAFLTRRTRAI